ncbi:hypothetical protein [Sphingomonas sp. TREG-RG-20F-R18-01]|uniref:hypothetical protein n=1 Tax=Sphingomonas sp. TREG-RG-20F-R18-01 TaxID=2914982 RepID=UPI001F590EAA|nr:hypothetical protein [Sphingomonas sp. TREG-RG-20F-R18-01]
MSPEVATFPRLRASLAPEYVEASYGELTGIVEAVYGPGMTPEAVEGFFDDVGKAFKSAGQSVGQFAQQAAPVLARAAPNILQGASSGMAFGPWGALAGAVTGGASGIMQQSNDPTLRAVGGVMHQVGSLASGLRGGGLGSIATGGAGMMPGAAGLVNSIFGKAGGGAGGPGGAGGGSVGTLMGVLSRPEMLNGLLSASMRGYGKRDLQIGGQQVPVHTLLSALSSLAGRAASEAAEVAENAEATPEFVLAAGESIGINPESSEGRTDALLTLLALTPSIWASARPPAQSTTVTVSQPDWPGLAPSAKPSASEVFEFADGAESWPEWPGNEWVEDWGREQSYA